MMPQAPLVWNGLRPGEIVTELQMAQDATVQFIGTIHTPWADPHACPKWGDEVDGPVCWINLHPRWQPALKGILAKDRLQLLYWLHLARRDLLQQSPRSDGETLGTFAIRSPLRPNPIASSHVRVIAIEGPLLSVRGLDCVNGTPLLDIKPEGAALKGDLSCPCA